MPANVETMAYFMESAQDVPWHGLGVPVDHEASPSQMLLASKLNWTVSKRPLFTSKAPEAIGSGSMFSSFEDYIQRGGSSLVVSDYFALVRDSDNKVLGPAGKDYIPVQNIEAFTFFKRFTDAGQMRMETAGSLQGGRQVWVLAKLKKSITLPGNDVVGSYLLLSSPHIWGKSLVVKFVTIRVVCNNTFTMAMNESSFGKGFRMPHIRAFSDEVAEEARISLGIADELFDGFASVAQKLAKAPLSLPALSRYISAILHPELMTMHMGKNFFKQSEAKQAELIVDPNSPAIDPMQMKQSASDAYVSAIFQRGADLESAKGTVWGAFNGVTYYVDHQAGRSRDNALYASWFGPKGAIKTQAYRRAIQIAEVVA